MSEPMPPLQPELLLPVLDLFDRPPSGVSARRPRGAGGGGGSTTGGGRRNASGSAGSRSGGGARRSLSASARTAGRAATAAFAYWSGDNATLRTFGLNLGELRSLDPIERIRRIVDVASGPAGNGTIEDEERRLVAAHVAQWVIDHDPDGSLSLEEVIRETIATIIFEAVASETGELLRKGAPSPWASLEGERQLRDSARALAARATLTTGEPTTEEITAAIGAGIETLRHVGGAA